MPFKSKAQQGFLFAKKPELAKKWADKYGVDKDLPEHVGDKDSKKKEALKRIKKKYS